MVLKSLMNKHKARKHGMALLLDFEKAYDRVNQTYLRGCLEKLGFPTSWTLLLEKVQQLSSSRVLVNNNLSSPISLGRGVRQGCPLSPLLFLVALEPLGMPGPSPSELHWPNSAARRPKGQAAHVRG